MYDELKAIKIEAFTHKYDPYWDIPLNENLPEPVLEIPMPAATEDAAQHILAFSDGQSRAVRPTVVTHVDHDDELYRKLLRLIAERHQITGAEVQATLGCAAAQARSILRRLVEENYAVIQGRGRASRYIAVSSTEVADAHPAGRPN